MRWLRIVPGAAIAAAVAYACLHSWSALVANHPAYPMLLLVSLAMAVWLFVSGLRASEPARRGGVRAVLRWLGAAAGIGLAALLVWLAPAVATDRALDALAGTPSITVSDSRTSSRYEPQGDPKAGLVLYPGGKVDPRAYAVLASSIAAEGYEVVVPKCPFDLEFSCEQAADRYRTDAMPWAVGGHSLGGVVASLYADGSDDLEGLVFWASYPVPDLSGRKALAVASISGSEDLLSSPADIDGARDLLPPDTVYTQIKGGIHGFFGDYGHQPGDGEPTISREDAQGQIVAATVALLERISATS